MTGVSLLIWLTLEQLVDLPEWSTISVVRLSCAAVYDDAGPIDDVDVGDDHGGCSPFTYELPAVYFRGRTGELNLTGRNSFRWACGVAGRDWHPFVICFAHPFENIGCGGGGGGNGITFGWFVNFGSSLSRRFGVLVDLGDQIPSERWFYEGKHLIFPKAHSGVLFGKTIGKVQRLSRKIKKIIKTNSKNRNWKKKFSPKRTHAPPETPNNPTSASWRWSSFKFRDKHNVSKISVFLFTKLNHKSLGNFHNLFHIFYATLINFSPAENDTNLRRPTSSTTERMIQADDTRNNIKTN